MTYLEKNGLTSIAVKRKWKVSWKKLLPSRGTKSDLERVLPPLLSGLANEKILRQIDLPDKLHLSPSAVSRMVARLEEKTVVCLVAGVVIR